eukprot:3120838-Rhodomonas_salina.2
MRFELRSSMVSEEPAPASRKHSAPASVMETSAILDAPSSPMLLLAATRTCRDAYASSTAAIAWPMSAGAGAAAICTFCKSREVSCGHPGPACARMCTPCAPMRGFVFSESSLRDERELQLCQRRAAPEVAGEGFGAGVAEQVIREPKALQRRQQAEPGPCLLYTSDAADDM